MLKAERKYVFSEDILIESSSLALIRINSVWYLHLQMVLLGFGTILPSKNSLSKLVNALIIIP